MLYKSYFIALAVSGAAILMAGFKPVTYRDIADQEAAHCVANNGFGEWVGSSGVTLETFCQTRGAIKAMGQLKKDHPERF